MAFLIQPLSPDSARYYFGSKPAELKRCAEEAQAYLNHLEQELVNGPPDIDPSFGLNLEKLNAGWASSMERKLKEAQAWVAGYAALLKEVG